MSDPDYTITELSVCISKLSNLPDDIIKYTNLKKLICDYNEITQCDNLPQTLEILECGNNYITQLDNLPPNLIELNCADNQISQLDNLPQSLKKLNCTNNQITQLNNLPQSLELLNCNNNPFIYDFEPSIKNIRKYIAISVSNN